MCVLQLYLSQPCEEKENKDDLQQKAPPQVEEKETEKGDVLPKGMSLRRLENLFVERIW